MSEDALHANLMRIGFGIEACLERKLIVPALILLYSGIDTAGWLDSVRKDATRESFLAWVDKYLLKAKPLPCTSLDLYAARCGLLHTLTADCRLSDEGRVRRVCYAWGAADAAQLETVSQLTGISSKFVAVHVNDLYEAWRHGLSTFTSDLDTDPARKARVQAKAARQLSPISGWRRSVPWLGRHRAALERFPRCGRGRALVSDSEDEP
jgi:hypothetical protein